MAEMQRLGLINDEDFARHRAKYLAGQNRSPREIRRRLAEKDVYKRQDDDGAPRAAAGVLQQGQHLFAGFVDVYKRQVSLRASFR